MAMKQRLLKLGYFRESDTLTDEYNDTCAERIRIFRRVNGLEEDGSAKQMLQCLLYSPQAKANPEPLPQARRLNSCLVSPGASGTID